MTTTADSLRILVLAPRGRDAELVGALLAGNGLDADSCAAPADLLARMHEGAGCAVITEEALGPAAEAELAAQLAAQPPWSDFPLLLLTGTGRTRSRIPGADLGNVTLIERPIAPPTFLTAVRAALRGRGRQYEARAAIEQRDQFLAMLGHELRNPLGAIVLASELVRGLRDRDQIDARLAMIGRQANLLARLVDDLLDVARVTSGKVQLRRESVDIDETIRSSIAVLSDQARERDLTVLYSASSGAVVDGDSVRLEQVFTNLLGNAIKYSPAGRTVTVSSATEGEWCEIRVRDQGIGIAPEMLPRVFDLFAQADGSLDRAEGGMGIGLTLVDRLVRLHGGTVAVTSRGLGFGSEFVVRVPLGSSRPVHGVIALPHASSDDHLRVVLVEDNADLRDLTVAMLEELGCIVEAAADGPDGVERIVRTHPDLALVDIGLPGMDGFAVAREVRARQTEPLLLVAVTGYGRTQDREQSRAAGFDLHLTKPLHASVLGSLLERARVHRPCTSVAHT